jgi:hypothetical protein
VFLVPCDLPDKATEEDQAKFAICAEALKRARNVWSVVVSTPPDGGRVEVPLPLVRSEVLDYILRYLTLVCTHKETTPFYRMKRPLTSPHLRDAHVPKFAEDFIKSIPLTEVLLLDIAEAARDMGIYLLEYLVTAWMSCMLIAIGSNKLQEIKAIPDLTPEQERHLKEQNTFAWENEPEPILDKEALEEAQAVGLVNAEGNLIEAAAAAADDAGPAGAGAGAGSADAPATAAAAAPAADDADAGAMEDADDDLD